MSLNHKEIDLILSELELSGTFVQDIVQPNFDSIAIYTFKPGVPKTVFVCLAGGECRIHETRRKITKNEKPLRFNELLKSKIKGARITSCAQIGSERIVKMTIERAGAVIVMPKAQSKLQKIQDAKGGIPHDAPNADESDNTERYNLYIRLWSNAANIFLCDEEDTIIDSFYRRPLKGEMTGEKFALPEAKNGGKTFEIRDFAETEEKLLEEQAKRGYSRKITFNEKVEAFYSESAAKTSLESLLETAEKWYNTHKSRQTAALEKLCGKKAEFLNASTLKHSGDLILAYSYMIDSSGEGSNFIEVEDWENGNAKVKIRIDPKKSAQENASDYYEKYKKSNSGLEKLEYDISIAKKSIEELDRQYAQMVAEKNPIKLEQILRKKQTPKQLEKKSHPGLDYQIDGWQIIVGRDADENDELLRHNVRGSDMWLHVRDYSGGYVFIKNRPGKTVPLEILLYAGNLAVYYSKARKNGSADLYYTQVKHLRRAKNGPKGLVLPTNEKNLFIKLDESKLRKLEEVQKGIEL